MALSETGERLITWRPVGRRRELRQMVAGVREAAAGRIGVLHLRGPRAIGKSALAELLRDEVCDEADVLVTTCGGDEDFTVARSLFGVDAVDALLTGRDAHARLYAMNELVVPRAVERPLVLVLDDAHLCDRATARWLAVLARRIPAPPVYVVLVYPCAERIAAEEMFAELSGALDTTTIDLGPFGEADVTELIARECGFIPERETVLTALECTAGVPEVTLAWAAKACARNTTPDVEAELAAWQHAWLEDQPESTRRYLTSVAVLGSTEPASAATLAEISPAEAEWKRRELVPLGVLTPDGCFRSPVLRERLLGALGTEKLAEVRTRAARLLTDEGRPQEEIAELVMLLPALTEVWMFCALRGAAREGTLSAELAVSYLRRVLDAVPGHLDTRQELAARLTEIDPSAAMDVYAELLADVTDPAVRASVAISCGAVALRAGRGPEGFRLLTGYLAEEGRAGRLAAIGPELRAQAEGMALANGFGGSATISQAMDRARVITSPEGRAEGGRRLAQQLARAEVLRGESLPAALGHLRSALPAPGGVREYWDVFTVPSLHFCGERAAAMTLVDEIVVAASASGDAHTRKLALATRAGLAFDSGDLLQAGQDAGAALEMAGPEDFCALTVLAAVLVRRGDTDRTEQLLHRMRTPRDAVEYGWALDAKAHWLWNCGDHDAALDMLQRCGREFDAMGVQNPVLVPWWIDAVAVTVRLGRLSAAAEIAERGADAARNWNTPAARGYALLAEGMSTGDVETLEQAVVELGAAESRLCEAQALRALGNALMHANDEKTARKHLRAAMDIAVRCGASMAADRAHELLTAAGGRVSAVHASPRDALTSGELRVAELAADGLTNREIAEKLYVTVRTVESHLSNAYRKLGAQTRTELAVELR
ncbi:regulatory LuxR family protein [Lentzea atacamensis]|uniref:Regulatory LuxR family protein n=1 Tax=Lentzea atacamensis TaxID=531938 RepID=A0ABX9EDY7_9PSEU|nr:LuxR family transcriptional regulator [Lentzea atacamensis]RAS66962.1 regulatory LuxR family protein [Lentzea atacamensis]